MTTRQITREEASHMAKVRCSDCWNFLQVSFTWNKETKQNEFFATCGTPDCPMHGFVSKRYVENREQVSHFEYREARHALRALLPKTITTEAETLADLGF